MVVLPAVRAGICGMVGVILVVLGAVIGWYGFPSIIKEQIKKNMVISPGTETWNAWVKTPIPVYMQFYFFNVTNAHNIVSYGEKPKVQQLGPYTYEEVREKKDIEMGPHEETVAFKQYIKYIFREDMSSGTEKDMITTLNAPLVGVVSKAVGLSPLLRFLLEIYILRFQENVFMIRPVHELLLGGYQESMISQLEVLKGTKLLFNETFGFFYPKNNSHSGKFVIYTGRSDITKLSVIKSWNDKTELNWWTGRYCNMINGTDGSMFPPFVSKEMVLYLFSTDLCRSLYATFEKEVQYKDISAYRFIAPKEMLADPAHNPDNMCFCVPKNKCLKAGVLDIASCQQGAPVIMSTPHFYQGSKDYLDMVDGLNPNKEKHETFIDIEPITGVVIRAAKRIQINVPLQRFGSFVQFQNVPKMLFPIMWVNENADLDNTNAEKFKSVVIHPVMIMNVVKWVMIGLGTFLIIITIIAYMTYKNYIKITS